MRVDGDLSESFSTGVRLRQKCVISPWLFNIFMDGCMKEMKDKMDNSDVRLKINGMGRGSGDMLV